MAESGKITTQREAIDSLISHLTERRNKGESVVSIEGLISVLSDQQRAFSAKPLLTPAEYMQHHTAFTLAEYQVQAEASNRLFESVISTAKEAIQSLLLINGGGCVALLALMGQLAPKISGDDLVKCFGLPLLGFAGGLVAAAFLGCLAYLGQSAYNAKKPKVGNFIQIVATIVGILSLAGFIFGSYSAFRGLTKMRFITETKSLI